MTATLQTGGITKVVATARLALGFDPGYSYAAQQPLALVGQTALPQQGEMIFSRDQFQAALRQVSGRLEPEDDAYWSARGEEGLSSGILSADETAKKVKHRKSADT